jgi:tRNA uridine 5-carbamoylmethylation protein Kti12
MFSFFLGDTRDELTGRFDNLLMRFEEPSSMVRWDSPLISIPWDEDPPFEDIWNVVMKGEKKGPTAATLQVSLLLPCLARS